MSFLVSTTLVKNSRGLSMRATCKGKQATHPVTGNETVRHATGAAAGMVLNKVLSPEQQAKVKHPSGAQRVTFMTYADGSGRVNIDV